MARPQTGRGARAGKIICALLDGPSGPISKAQLRLFAAFQEHAMSQDLFFSRTGMDRAKVQQTVDKALDGADDGELFLEYSQSESFAYDDNRLKAASFDTSQGFGLRSVAGEATGYAHATEISEDAIRRAGETVRAVSQGYSGTAAGAPARTNVKLYSDI